MDEHEMRTITVSGTAEVRAPSDITTVSVSLEGVKAEYKEAVEELTEVIAKLRKCVVNAGLEADALKTTAFSVKQHYKRVYGKGDRYSDYKDVPDGFSYETGAYFEFPNDKKVLTDAVYGIMRLKVTPRVTFGFRNSDPAKMKEDALREATRRAMDEARIIVETAGHRLGRLMSVDRASGYYPPRSRRDEREMEFACYDADVCCSKTSMPWIDVDPADDSDVASVTLTWEIGD